MKLRPFSYSETNENRMTFCYILWNFRMCTIVIEALTLFDRASRIQNVQKNNARSRLFCKIATVYLWFSCRCFRFVIQKQSLTETTAIIPNFLTDTKFEGQRQIRACQIVTSPRHFLFSEF